MTRARRLLAAVLMFVAAVASGCGVLPADDSPSANKGVTCRVDKSTQVKIATGNSSGVYNQLGSALASQLSNATGGGVKATAVATDGSAQNLEQIAGGQADVGFTLSDTAVEAVSGTNGRSIGVQALSQVHTNYTHVLVRTDRQIRTLKDLKGKKVSTGSPKSGTEVIARRVLAAAGLNAETDIQRQPTDLGPAAEALRTGKIDALFWSGGLPTPGITELVNSARDKVRMLDIAEALTQLKQFSTVYATRVIPADTYGFATDVNTIISPNLLVARRDLDPNIACLVTMTVFDYKQALINASSAAQEISLERARRTDSVPLHEGAVVALDKLGAAK